MKGKFCSQHTVMFLYLYFSLSNLCFIMKISKVEKIFLWQNTKKYSWWISSLKVLEKFPRISNCIRHYQWSSQNEALLLLLFSYLGLHLLSCEETEIIVSKFVTFSNELEGQLKNVFTKGAVRNRGKEK